MRYLFALGALATLACVSQDANAIVSGDPSSVDGVGLVLFTNDTVCSGFLASPNVVVTAAFCFNDGKTPVAFYTGAGTAVTAPGSVASAANLVKHDIKSYAKHPQASPQAAETGAASYTAHNDIGYVVLATKAKETPLAYGGAATNPCIAHGYGRNGNILKSGNIGARLSGAVSVNGTVGTAIQVTAGHFANSGDFGGPLICANKVAGIFSAYHYNAQSVIDIDAFQPITDAMKTFIDDAITANPPPVDVVPDAGTDAAVPIDAGSDPVDPDPANESKSSSPSDPAPTETTRPTDDGSNGFASQGGCSTSGGGSGWGWIAGLAAALATIRVSRRKMR